MADTKIIFGYNFVAPLTLSRLSVCVCVFGGGGGGGGEGVMGCVQSREFNLLGSLSDTLPGVSILDMSAICSRFCSPEGVKEEIGFQEV